MNKEENPTLPPVMEAATSAAAATIGEIGSDEENDIGSMDAPPTASLSVAQRSQMILSLVSPSEKAQDESAKEEQSGTLVVGLSLNDELKSKKGLEQHDQSAYISSGNGISAKASPGAFSSIPLSGLRPPPTDSPQNIAEDVGSSSTSLVVTAMKVDDVDETEDVEERVRQRIIDEAIQASVVLEEGSQASAEVKENGSNHYFLLGLCVAVLFAVGLVLLVVLSNKSTEAPSDRTPPPKSNTTEQDEDTPKTIFDEVASRGTVRCGVYLDMPGFSFMSENGTVSGFNYEMCRAVAAASLGDGDMVELVPVDATNRFKKLNEGDIDLISQTVTVTMERDVAEQTSGLGVTFSYPFYFSGFVFGGLPDFVACAERRDPFNGICRGLKVCVVMGTTQDATLQTLLPGSSVVRFPNPVDAIPLMNNGTCNTIAAEALTLNPTRLKQIGLSSELNFTVGSNTFSRDPLALVTSDSDPEWSALVNSVVKILYTCEREELTKENVLQSLETREDLNPDLIRRVVNVVQTVGNYGELYKRHVDPLFPRAGANTLNPGLDSGLIYSYPFGNIFRVDEISSPQSHTITSIQKRGFLTCGIPETGSVSSSNVSETLSVLDGEMCRALAAGLFVGDSDRVQYVYVEEPTGFTALTNGSVDVLAGQPITLSSEFFEPTTRTSFSFSEPYFRNLDGSTRAFATRRDDTPWTSFVYWTLNAIIFAEEEGLNSEAAILIPPVPFFGDFLLQSFRDTIAAVGNYGEIYNRTMTALLPRDGGNFLNVAPFGPQQVAYPFV